MAVLLSSHGVILILRGQVLRKILDLDLGGGSNDFFCCSRVLFCWGLSLVGVVVVVLVSLHPVGRLGTSSGVLFQKAKEG